MSDEAEKLFDMENVANRIQAISKQISEVGTSVSWNMKFLMGFNRYRKFSSSTNAYTASIEIHVRLPDGTPLNFQPGCGTARYEAVAVIVDEYIRERLEATTKNLKELQEKLPLT